MSKRLQVLFDDPEYKQLQKIAKAKHLTIAEYVRQTLRHDLNQISLEDPNKKLRHLHSAISKDFPSSDIDQMLSEIEHGYLEGH